MPDSNLSAAIREAYSVAPTTSVIYHTLEIHHPSFADPIRVVRAKRAISAKLEATAPRNAGTVQTFTALSFEIAPPDQSLSQTPTCTVKMDNVSRDIGAALDTAVMSGSGKTTVIYRAFLSDALTVGPEHTYTMTLFGVSLDATTVTAVCGFPDLLSRKFPEFSYTIERFPGLGNAN